MDCLAIRWNSTGTHAEVFPASAATPPPADCHLLCQGDRYYGIPFDRWAALAGTTVDVLHLQFAVARAQELWPPVAIAVRVEERGWQHEDTPFETAPPGSEFGFSTGARLVPCSQEQLGAQCVGAPETPWVWTPRSADLVRPEHVAFLVEALRQHRRAAAERSMRLAGLVLAVSALVSWRAPMRSGWVVLSALAAAWFAVTLLERRRARSSGVEAFAAARDEFRHDVWVRSRRAIHTEILLLLLVGVALAETLDLQAAIAAAGLVKPAVREGEFWRLLTGPLLHGGVLHLALNGLALWSLGPLVEAHSRRAFLPLLFLVSALSGSAFSLLLLPEGTSVGASGGILGLAGFLVVLGFRRSRSLPSGFVQRLGVGILATAVFGIVGYGLVDNATHLGGLLGGVAMAILPLWDEERTAATPHNGRWLGAGGIALALLVLGAVVAVAAIHLGTGGAADVAMV